MKAKPKRLDAGLAARLLGFQLPLKINSSVRYATSKTHRIASRALPPGIGLLMPFLLQNRITTPNDRVAVIVTEPLTDNEVWTPLPVSRVAMFSEGEYLVD